MANIQWLRSVQHRMFSRQHVESRRRLRPSLEVLEDRTVPADFHVGPGDVSALVADIKTANSNGESNVINLFNGSIYDLSKIDNYWYGPNGLPPITSNLTIHGNGAIIERAPASGTADFRLFYVSGGMELPAGILTMDNVTLENGLAKGGDSDSGGGGLGAGGAIFNQGTLNLTDATLADNTAQGGSSGVSTAGLGGGGMGQDAPTGTAGGGFGGSVGQYGGTGGAGNQNGGGGGGGFLAGANGSEYPGHGGGLGGFSTLGADGGAGGGTGRGQVPGGDGGNFGSGGGITSDGGTESGGLTDNGGGGGGVGGGGSAVYGYSGAGGFGGGGGGGGAVAYQGGNGGFGAGGGAAAGYNGDGGAGSGGFGGGNGNVGNIGGGGAGMGGAIFNMGADSAQVGSGQITLVDCTFTKNTAQGGSVPSGNGAGALGQGIGGALFNLDGSATLTNDTVSGNHASFAGQAVYNLAYGNDIDTGAPVKASLVLNNNILGGGSSGPGPALVSAVSSANLAATATVSGGHNLVVSSAGTINSGVITVTTDPMLGPLQYNGGLTQTMKPQPGSPVLGAGDRSVAPSTDQRGVSRFQGLLPIPIDLGSVQVSGFIATPPNPPAAPPTLYPPPLLGIFDALLHGVETINSNGTETVVDRLFGFPLLVSTYDGAGHLMSVNLFGFNVTILFELL